MAWVFELIDKKFINFQPIADEKKILIINQINIVNELMKYNELFIEFQRSYEEYLRLVDGSDINNDRDVVLGIKNYLASYKSYIDGMETLISRSFSNEIYEKFKKFQNKTFDENFNYRFIYNLRNYAQHCGSPISSISREINQGTKIELKVDKFLSEHTGMQKIFRKELECHTSDVIDVGIAMDSVYNLIVLMQDSILNLIIDNRKDDFLQSAYGIVLLYNKTAKHNGELCISNDDDINNLRSSKIDDSIVLPLGITPIPYQLAKLILKNISIKFTLEGKSIGQSKNFPQYLKVESIIHIPKFLTGSKFVLYKNIKWVRIIETIDFAYKDGYDRYTAIYVPSGLSIGEYAEIEERLKTT